MSTVKATYYSAPWCQPCKSFKPVAIPKIVEAGIDFNEVDVERDPDWAAADDVMSLPTIVFYAEGDDGLYRTFARVNGASNKQLDEALKKAQEYIEK